MKGNFYGTFFRFVQFIIRKMSPTYHVQIPNQISGPVAYISHHQNTFGPFVIMLWFPKSLHAWILHVFLNQTACYKQYAKYTFTKRIGMNKHLAKICALPLSYLITKLLHSGKGIPVYRGSRQIMQTFNQSVAALQKGEDIAIFPDIDYSDTSSRTNAMYEGFLYLEKYYYKITGQHVCFVPLYASKSKKVIIADPPIYFRDGEDFNKERKIVYQKIHDQLNLLAKNCGDLNE
ncbi:glycerol acyltransferase [Peribacillus loiseleuriae]|uniref:glycerol acyltransferase n=1 Tax=Peribacillus loiseleuriae TaxID=1679170 RepID=UPI003805E5C4